MLPEDSPGRQVPNWQDELYGELLFPLFEGFVSTSMFIVSGISCGELVNCFEESLVGLSFGQYDLEQAYL